MVSTKYLAFPDELLVAVFLELDVDSIIACQKTCKRFQHIIEDSVHVQYHVELQLACMKNGPNSDTSTASRLSMLRAQRRAWAALSWSTPEPVVLPTPPGVTKWKLCIRLPSPIRGIEQREWRIDHTCGENDLKWDFCHDPSQDLLVLFEEFKISDEEESHSAFKIHFLAISTGTLHPAATSPVLLYAPKFRYCDINVSLTLQVCGQHLAMAMEDNDCKEQPKFVIWDWVSGLTKMEISYDFNHSFQSFSLLPDNLVLVGAARYIEELKHDVHLSVYDLGQTAHSGSYTLTDVDDCSYVCRLRFDPELSDEDIFISSMPLPLDEHMALDNEGVERASPFMLAPEAQLIVVYLGACWTSTRVFFPVSAIMKHVSSTRRSGASGIDVPWCDWGLSSRVFVDSFRNVGSGNVWQRDSTRGLRFATVLNRILSNEDWVRREFYEVVAITDFNPLAHTARSGLGKVWTRPQPESERWEAKFRASWREEDQHSRWWDSCLLGEDLIVLVSESWHRGQIFAVMTLKEPAEEPTSAA
ncbi:hypothetical protein CONPUDRAFT_165745 [Coniophora puteana RWD-64-598 SS2]|uniref:F-box domain-containing protein n=1 Tax=Coniophora puteana (strain RWD-64-598) TaxID=741705 RepID=A0A5M3MN55_CONPW|nr:uncharacterized protein CONPUDRAFT_165745 [Coniophora puteana RWD-64-598 SS2]EIW80145.1 hypothetical protein CONPUDRAFT_165745 [Coniophora puteana RWD-64-598 SS2]